MSSDKVMASVVQASAPTSFASNACVRFAEPLLWSLIGIATSAGERHDMDNGVIPTVAPHEPPKKTWTRVPGNSYERSMPTLAEFLAGNFPHGQADQIKNGFTSWKVLREGLCWSELILKLL